MPEKLAMEEEGARWPHRSSKPAWRALRSPEGSTPSPLRHQTPRLHWVFVGSATRVPPAPIEILADLRPRRAPPEVMEQQMRHVGLRARRVEIRAQHRTQSALARFLEQRLARAMVEATAQLDRLREAEHPGRDDARAGQLRARIRAALDYFRKLRNQFVGNVARLVSLGRAEMDDARSFVDIRPFEPEHFHLARAARDREVARIAKFRAQVPTHAHPVVRLDEACADVEMLNLRDVWNRAHQASLAGDAIGAARVRQFEMNRVGRGFRLALVDILEPERAVDLLRAMACEPLEQRPA